MSQNSKGPGYWKFNSSMVEDEIYVADLKQKIRKWKNEYQNILDRRTVWELFKYEIRRYSMQYGARKNKAQQQALDILRFRLKKLECDMSVFDDLKEDYYEVCEQIKACEQVEAQGMIVRSKVQFIEENEKCTKYFFQYFYGI